MVWLTSLPAAVHVVGWLVLSIAVVMISGRVVRAIVAPEDREHVQGIAAPLMPALGAAFAVLTALTLSSEAGYLRSAQDIVSNEAAQASRLAWASTSPGVNTAAIQDALTNYLVVTRATEWHGENAAEADAPAMASVIASLMSRPLRPTPWP